MYNNFPFFTTNGLHSLVQIELPGEAPAELMDLLYDLIKAAQLINVLRSLHDPTINETFDLEIEEAILNRISQLLLSAATKTQHKNLKKSLEEKSKSFKSLNYSETAFKSSLLDDLPIEILVGSLPSWRYPGKPRTFSALIALPDFSDNELIENADLESIEQVKDINRDFGYDIFESPTSLPRQITCDIIALGGDFASHPMHIAHFLPEDEGYYDSITYKTLIYRNLYLLRYKEISLSISGEFYASNEMKHPQNDKDLWRILSVWFRGHDIGHTYFDSILKKMPGLNRRKRYALQETMADLFGYFLTIRTLYKKESYDINSNIISSVYMTEIIRYMTRDSNLFPDSKAAWFQLGYLLNEKAVIIGEEGKIEVNLNLVTMKLNNLMNHIIKKALKKETAIIETMLENYSTLWKDRLNDIYFNKASFKEINPVFNCADNLIDKGKKSNLITSVRSNFVDTDFDFRKRF